MSLLYEAESRDLGVSEVVAGLPVAPDPYVLDLVEGVEAGVELIDKTIGDYAIDWTVARMPALDRALLRVAVFELRERADVPMAVVISEAVELAGQYSTDGSSRFVNGVLARMATDLRPDETSS